MHDARFDVPTRDEIIAALDKLLETPRAAANGGWPEVSFERMHELDDFFLTVRKAVFAPDPDGAAVITWEMLNRAHHYNPAPGMRIPHRIDTPEKVRDALNVAAGLSRAAAQVSDRVNAEMRFHAGKA
jgi:hypothetical protein